MDLIKRKIFLEDGIDRSNNSSTWGQVTATTFNIKIFLTQDIDDMGLFSDAVYIPLGDKSGTPPNYTILVNKLITSGFTFPFMSGALPPSLTGLTKSDEISLRFPSDTVSNYFNYGNKYITASTESQIEDVKTYNPITPYKVGFNVSTNTYTSYTNTIVSGVSRVTYIGEPTNYVFDAPVDVNIGTNNQIWGLLYQDYSGLTREVTINNVTTSIPITNVRYKGQGWNETNVSLSALTKNEYLFGIVSPPEVQSDVDIDRGTTSVLEMHLRLSEIKTVAELVQYGNGFYNITTQ